jgi:hypothetical protein
LSESTGKNPGNSRPEYCFQLPSIFRCKPAVSRRTSFTWVDIAIDELANLQIAVDNTVEQSSNQMILNETRRNLNNFLDNLWNIVDPENVTDLHEIIESIRNLFNSLFHLIQEQEKNLLN